MVIPLIHANVAVEYEDDVGQDDSKRFSVNEQQTSINA
jgi:hypothetical protein